MFSLFFYLLLLAEVAIARTWYVYPDGSGGDAPTIQAAVDSAASGDWILLKGGIYHESGIVINGKAVQIDRFDGLATIISPVPGEGTCITIRNVPSGFTLNSLSFRGFETALAVENSSGYFQWFNVSSCFRGLAISGAASSPLVHYALIDSCSTGIEIAGGSAVQLNNETIAHCSTGIASNGGNAAVARCIVYSCSVGVACSGGIVDLSCNDFFLCSVNYSGCTAGSTDFYADPMFCLGVPSSPGPYWLHKDSPCFTGSNPCGVRVGAFVSIAGCTGTAVEEASWGAIKQLYR